MKSFYITTPIYYVNDRPHIGHAYTTIAADVLARWKRMQGEKVFFLTGTDEHGSKIAQASLQAGITPEAYATRTAEEFKSLWKLLNISNDDFIRTTETRHIKTVQAILTRLYDQGEIYKGFYEDWYCVACESFWLENQLKGAASSGWQCPECARPVEKLKEESYFFKLSKYGDRLLQHYKENPDFLSPYHRAQEMIQFVRQGLKDLSVSRLKEKWGIPVPFALGHTAYVWFDALINYLSATHYELKSLAGIEDQASPQISSSNFKFEETWPCDIHFVGKEIFRFHTVIWPAMLMALGLPLPKKVFAHGWWTVEGDKMSKSKGNIVDPVEVCKEFGADSFRYFLLREMPFGADGDFSKIALLKRYNFELANDLGNLFSRILTLIEKNFSGVIRKMPKGFFMPLILEKNKKITESFEKSAFQEVLEDGLSVAREANRYLEVNAPWKLVKTNPELCESVLAETLIVLRWLSALYHPFMPELSQRMWQQLGELSKLEEVAMKVFREPIATYSPGTRIQKQEILFPRKA
ncbi:MAG: methionine--tRNA ligase [Elusimicrobia bacterium RIFCSPLOWO2_02_FULL_39_32]|nr:MAG: methionine--tRNA ligase [Elusimicrobia bacterium RIFCSPHIGHO2_02_FULL_39_36]OGR91520.1 MAG: methionine--tRNA ligase [Elusimicrobia bacterium RIFCSPLOWO2_02_FULL_39_32]OGS00775.1 MAG: methionine--tRNA ligase [Elusimicrobia bacterium RIFCSPLOWO2_12_FULL_39_28]